NAEFDARGQHERRVSAGSLNAMGLIDEIFHYVCMLYRRDKRADAFAAVLEALDAEFGKDAVDGLLLEFAEEFPPVEVYQGGCTAAEYLARSAADSGTGRTRTNREQTLEEWILLRLANANPAFKPFSILFDDAALSENGLYGRAWAAVQKAFQKLPVFGPFNHDLITMLREPVVFSPNSLKGQLDYIRQYWAALLGDWLKRLLAGMDALSEEEKMLWHPTNGGDVSMEPYNYDGLMKEYERFSPDREWMPCVVLMAKTVLVWLDQLTKKYQRPIGRLDQIPDEELDLLRDEGFTGLWLIGLWERSYASKRVKQICGNPEAAASAYSLYDYNIAANIGGWDALSNLRSRLWQRGIRLASDMVPNHTGMDSDWVINKPDLFVQRRDAPSLTYTFNGENLSQDPRIGVYLEDHYYSKSDCSVVFKRVDNQTGDVRYIYHGNDGTGMPWNDTAQIDFLNPAAREEVMQEILHVARNFPIIRFDAAMVLAKKHIRRLWYPEPGHGGDIYTRSETGLSNQEFNERIPNEFWREVVDRVAKEVPDTLLLAEAFWMMEGYFVRTLGMHRVYNSAFMNMLKKEENQKYRDTVKNTIKFDPQILKRYVNFMNNPDEETAVAQFGKDDKYFGVCTLMITMPGLPMFGHGQIEGFTEKYGMEFTKAYRNETPDQNLINRHWHDIFPLMKKRYVFANVDNFLFYDVWDNGGVNENIYAYSNRCGNEHAVVFYNNKYERAQGWIKQSCEYAVKTGSGDDEKVEMRSRSLSEGLGLTAEDDKFCLFREHRTGLWFVRRSREICERGMFISLNGFEYQVLMDIHQVADMPDHRYQILCDTLQGRGCYDLEVEWQEICYRDLYHAFAPFATAVIPAVHGLLKPADGAAVSAAKAKKALKELFASCKEAALGFYETANRFAGTERAFPSAEKQFETFGTLLETVVVLAAECKAKVSAELPEALKKAKSAAAFLETAFANDGALAEALACYAMVKEYADAQLAERWAVVRKLDEYFQSAGASCCDIRPALSRLFAFAGVAPADAMAKDGKKAAYAVVSRMTQGCLASALSGANRFNNIVWFNKEASDVSLVYAFALALAPASEAQAAAALKVYADVLDAKVKAEYRCEEFLRPFAPKESEAKADPAKPKSKAEKPAKAGTSAPAEKKPAAKKGGKKK
nr:alpha-amylase [Treponemataceae bacterium]